MAGGRPRTITPDPEDMVALGEEMVKWVEKNKPIHLSMWYTQVKDFTDHQWDSFRRIPEFLHYYTKALKLVGYGYLDKDSNVDVRLKDRWQRVYFKDLKQEEDDNVMQQHNLKKELMELEAKIKSKEQTQTSEEDINRLESILEQMRDRQKDSKKKKGE